MSFSISWLPLIYILIKQTHVIIEIVRIFSSHSSSKNVYIYRNENFCVSIFSWPKNNYETKLVISVTSFDTWLPANTWPDKNYFRCNRRARFASAFSSVISLMSECQQVPQPIKISWRNRRARFASASLSVEEMILHFKSDISIWKKLHLNTSQFYSISNLVNYYFALSVNQSVLENYPSLALSTNDVAKVFCYIFLKV